jgi:nitrogen regulatory protein PII
VLFGPLFGEERLMKLVVAIIAPEKLEAVEAALKQRGVHLLSISQVLGDGDEPGRTAMYRGTEFHVRRSRLRLEAAVEDEVAEGAVEAIARSGSAADSRSPGDVKVVVSSLAACISPR